MAMADHELHTSASCRIDNGCAFVKRESDWFLNQEMLAVLRAKHGVLGVILMRRRHINRFYRRVGAQFLDRRVTFGAEVRGKALARLRPRIRRRHQLDARIARKCRQHHGKCAAQAGHAETELAFARLAQRTVYLDKIAEHSLVLS